MISKKQIMAIKATQRDAGLADEAYRQLLLSETGVSSCKELDPEYVPRVIKAIRATAAHRKGWQLKQIRKFKQYAKFCGMSNNQARAFLFKETQIPHEESPYLKNTHFDDVMMELESELEFRIQEGRVPRPEKVDLNYWRGRHPASGKANTRETHKIEELWYTLADYLPKEKQTISYLLGLAAKASQRHVSNIEDLTSVESMKLIEALKSRLSAEKTKLADEVPF